MGEIGGETRHKSYWTFSKQGFFPEESFQSWGNNHSALSQTCFQFKGNLISCSDDANEIAELQKQSETEMKRCLTWWDLNWFGFGCRWSWYFCAHRTRGLHTCWSCHCLVLFCFWSLSNVLCILLHRICSWNHSRRWFIWLLENWIGRLCGFHNCREHIAWKHPGQCSSCQGMYSYFTSLLDSPSSSLRIHSNLAEGFNLLDPISVRVLVIAATIAMTSTRETSVFNWIATALNTAVILFVKIAGLLMPIHPIWNHFCRRKGYSKQLQLFTLLMEALTI